MRRWCTLALVGALAAAAGCGGDDQAETLRRSAAEHQAVQQGLAAREATDALASQDEAQAVGATSPPGPATPAAAAAGAAAAADEPTALLTAADRESFSRLARTLPGDAGIAVTATGLQTNVESAGDLKSGIAWSTAKLPVAMAAIQRGVGQDADLTAAITASDNAAAERLFAALGGGDSAAAAATDEVRAAGDPQTTIEGQRLRAGYTPFGQTAWSLADQARFAAGLGCTTEGKRVRDLMRQTIPAQRWGLGRIGSTPAIKGGWGPGRSPGQADGWLERQLGVVKIDGRPVAIAIASTAPDHVSGTQALDEIAMWAKTHVAGAAAPATPAC